MALPEIGASLFRIRAWSASRWDKWRLTNRIRLCRHLRWVLCCLIRIPFISTEDWGYTASIIAMILFLVQMIRIIRLGLFFRTYLRVIPHSGHTWGCSSIRPRVVVWPLPPTGTKISRAPILQTTQLWSILIGSFSRGPVVTFTSRLQATRTICRTLRGLRCFTKKAAILVTVLSLLTTSPFILTGFPTSPSNRIPSCTVWVTWEDRVSIQAWGPIRC